MALVAIPFPAGLIETLLWFDRKKQNNRDTRVLPQINNWFSFCSQRKGLYRVFKHDDQSGALLILV